MARAMKEEIGNLPGVEEGDSIESETRWLQEALGAPLEIELEVDGMYGAKTKEAVRRLQERFGLQVDGVTGPITKAKLRKVLEGA